MSCAASSVTAGNENAGCNGCFVKHGLSGSSEYSMGNVNFQMFFETIARLGVTSSVLATWTVSLSALNYLPPSSWADGAG